MSKSFIHLLKGIEPGAVSTGRKITDAITGDGVFIDEIDEFSISRFDDNYMKNFWDQVSGSENTLVAEAASL